MNINLDNLPLPNFAEIPSGHRRRHRIGGLDLARRDAGRFLQAASALPNTGPVPGTDAIVTAARSLRLKFAGNRLAPCIRLRRRCLTALRAMARDPEWILAPAQRACIARLLEYGANGDFLVPGAEPVVGGLDAAVLVDRAWPELREAFADYLDFRRLRAEEAMLQGVPPHALTSFGHAQWQEAREAERAWVAHANRCGLSRYAAPASGPLFQVH
jgi:hypothetical protein